MKCRAAIIGLTSINIAGALALAWMSINIIFYETIMVEELSICAGLTAVIIGITWGAFALDRRGKKAAAIALLSVAALPIVGDAGSCSTLRAIQLTGSDNR